MQLTGRAPGRHVGSRSSLNKKIVSCRKCPRLVEWREQVAEEKVRRFADQKYWGRPVTGFGDPEARLLIVGLAPAAHGANRTGRMFTGDRSGDWLYHTLHKFGFSSSPDSTSREDGMTLKNCYITAVVRCAPPANKPLPDEIEKCRPFLLKELSMLTKLRVVMALGRIAFEDTLTSLNEAGITNISARPKFSHGATCNLGDSLTLIASYHPSQQNTFTGKLTRDMFDTVFEKAAGLLSE